MHGIQICCLKKPGKRLKNPHIGANSGQARGVHSGLTYVEYAWDMPGNCHVSSPPTTQPSHCYGYCVLFTRPKHRQNNSPPATPPFIVLAIDENGTNAGLHMIRIAHLNSVFRPAKRPRHRKFLPRCRHARINEKPVKRGPNPHDPLQPNLKHPGCRTGIPGPPSTPVESGFRPLNVPRSHIRLGDIFVRLLPAVDRIDL